MVLVCAFVSCNKDTVDNVPYSVYGLNSSRSLLKIVYASAYAANPSVLLRINGQVVSNLLPGRTPFPGGGFNTTGSNYPLYLDVPQGSDSIAVAIPKAGTSIDSVLLYSTVFTLPDNNAYTLHIADTLVNSTTNKTISVLVKNDLGNIDAGYSRYRFVNLIPNVSTTNGAVDLYLNGIKVDSNIAYKQAGNVFNLPIGKKAPGVTDTLNIPTPTWIVRPAGALPSSAALATYASTNTMANQRAFTIFSMGYQGATGTRLPFVSFTLDKNN